MKNPRNFNPSKVYSEEKVKELLDKQKRELLEEIEKMRFEVPEPPFMVGKQLTEEFVSKIIIYSGRYNYDKALNDVLSKLK